MMPFFRFSDMMNVEWLARQPSASNDTYWPVAPSGFPGYVEIRYPARQFVSRDRHDARVAGGAKSVPITQEAYMHALAQARTNVAPPIEHHFLVDQPELAAAVLNILSPHATRSSNRMLQCAFWEGSSCNGCDAPMFQWDHQGFYLFEGPESSVLRWLVDQGDRQSPRWNEALAGQEPPCLIWPEGHEWFLVLPYSYPFAVVACARGAAEEISRVAGLDASLVDVGPP